MCVDRFSTLLLYFTYFWLVFYNKYHTKEEQMRFSELVTAMKKNNEITIDDK